MEFLSGFLQKVFPRFHLEVFSDFLSEFLPGILRVVPGISIVDSPSISAGVSTEFLLECFPRFFFPEVLLPKTLTNFFQLKFLRGFRLMIFQEYFPNVFHGVFARLLQEFLQRIFRVYLEISI